MGKPTTGFGLVIFCLVLALLVALHLPFVPADAEANLGFSRGPFTDEGLYTAQVRNAMRLGTLDLAESDGVIKEPLFAAFAWGVLSTFGDSLTVMRWATLVLCAALLAVLAAGRSAFSRAVLVGLPVVALSYYPFHYGHLALVEMTASALIIAALWAVHQRLLGAGLGMLVLSAFLVLLAYGMKVQFVYAAVIPPTAFAIAVGMNWAGGVRPTRRALFDVVGASVAAAGAAAVFALAWFLPNRPLMAFVLGFQTSQRSSEAGKLVGTVMGNVQMLLMDRRIWAVILVAVVGVVVAVLAGRAVRRRGGAEWPAFVALMAPPIAWVLVELHKLTLSYLPSRYFISLIVALGLLGAAGMVAGWRWLGQGDAARASAVDRSAEAPAASRPRAPVAYTLAAVLLLALVLDTRDYANAFQRRTYAIRDAQQQLAAEGRWNGQLVMGPWAATLFWGSGAITKPVWKGYFNDGAVMRTLHPVVIVSEPDQDDSDQAFQHQGIALGEPVRSVQVRNWTVNLYQPAGR